MILYTTNCPRCKVLEAKLNAKNISYDICSDVNVMEEKGFMEAPMLEINGVVYSFNDALKLVSSY